MDKQLEKLVENLNKAIEKGVDKMPDMASHVIQDVSKYYEALGWRAVYLSALLAVMAVICVPILVIALKKAYIEREKDWRKRSELPTMISFLSGIGMTFCIVGAVGSAMSALERFAAAASPIGKILTQ